MSCISGFLIILLATEILALRVLCNSSRSIAKLQIQKEAILHLG